MAETKFMAPLPPTTRLAGPTFAPDRGEVYAKALCALNGEGIPFLIGGALALNTYTGIWRDTKDVDIFCRPEEAGNVLAALEKHGFRTEVVYESWLGKGWIDDVFVDIIWRNANGLFPVTDEWFEHAHRESLLGEDVLMIPLEETILSKMMVGGRYRFDGADILHTLFAVGERIDWARLAEGAGEHVGLLLAYLHMFRWGYPAWAHKVPDEVLERYAKLAHDRRSTFGPFRAMLMDIQSFSVDVEDFGLPNPHRMVLERLFGDAEGRT